MKTAESWLRKTLHYEFDDVALFEQAITHRSASGQNNERLEFLGDAVLDFVMSEFIYRARPEAAEGDLSKLRSFLVKGSSLAKLAVDLDLGEHLILGSGELKSGGHRRESILADAVEALFGAVFLDGGLDSARQVIANAFGERLSELPEIEDLRDPKTRLQEWLQARRMPLPLYELADVAGKDHKRRFTVTCTVAEFSATSRGEATTRRKAEQKAARVMFEKLTSELQ